MSEQAVPLKRSAKRCLFGRPDKEELSRELHKELAAMEKKNCERFGFDFTHDVPLPGGPYEYEALRVENIPHVYHPRLVRRAHRRPPALPPPASDDFDADVSSSSKSPESSVGFSYSKPITRSVARLMIERKGADEKELKQAKLTNYLSVRKRRSETNLVGIEAAAESSSGKGKYGAGKDTMIAAGGGDDDGTPRKPKSCRLRNTTSTAAPSSPFRFATEKKFDDEGGGDDGDEPHKMSPTRKRRAATATTTS